MELEMQMKGKKAKAGIDTRRLKTKKSISKEGSLSKDEQRKKEIRDKRLAQIRKKFRK